ncbi:hypothetical protein Golax_015172 [Gossypium laxum]|uniref:RNase H type-1 domain-containing protein n=1 Tax=Gossypium laxum TaxID=34288 RepID=A0A7J8ZX01_9ROSI|nr:hypothetical protein [Gossypium laxum]
MCLQHMLRESDSDQISLQWLPAGKFSLAKTYKHLLNTSGPRQFGYDRLIWRVVIPQKESNKVADCIANVAGSEMNQLVVFVDPPSRLQKFSEEDIDNSMQITSSGL